MSLVTVSSKRNRVYRRKFDHEQARERHAAGESIAALARAYGVSWEGVRRVVDPVYGAKLDESSKRWLMSGRCAACGKQGISRNGPFAEHGLCRDCANAQKTTSVRPDTLRCSGCLRWLPDDRFNRDARKKARRGRGSHCKDCKNRARKEYRAETKSACVICGAPTLSLNEQNAGRRSQGVAELDYCRCQSCARRMRWARERKNGLPSGSGRQSGNERG